MPRFRLLDGIHGEHAQRVGHMKKLRIPRCGERWCRGGRGGGVSHLGKIVTGGARASLRRSVDLPFSRDIGAGTRGVAPLLANMKKEQAGRLAMAAESLGLGR